MKAWDRLGRRVVADFGFVKVRSDRLRVPSTGHEDDFYTVVYPDWVCVVAEAPSGNLALVRQWRWGAEVATVELPGGIVDPGEASEDAARRELREETGLACGSMRFLGAIHPNPANQSNRCHIYLATDCRWEGLLELDDGESIEVIEMSLDDLKRAVVEGRVTHALVIAALYLFEAAIDAKDP